MGVRTKIICGFLKCDELLFHPILRHLPTVLHVSSDATPADHWLAATIRHTTAEASKAAPGSRSMLPRLIELMFVEILRKHMQSLSVDEVGWFAAFNDPVAGAALRHLHTVPLQDWSVESLARRVGVSHRVGRSLQALSRSTTDAISGALASTACGASVKNQRFAHENYRRSGKL